MVGLTRENGQVAAVLLPCRGYLDGVSVFQYLGGASGPDGDENYAHLGDWALSQRVVAGQSTTLVLRGLEETAPGVLALPGEDPAVPVTVEAYTEDNRWRARGPDVGEQTLAGLTEGTVLYAGVGEDGSFGTFSVPTGQFVDGYCDIWADPPG